MPQSIDSNGFTTFTAHASTNKIYVSSSYTGSNGSSIGTYLRPYTTINDGWAAVTSGQADWLMLKKGDTFNGADGAGLALSCNKSGLSASDPILITCYDDADPTVANPATATPRPIITPRWVSTSWAFDTANNTNLAFAGLEIYSPQRDPTNLAEYSSAVATGVLLRGIISVSSVTGISSLLIEDCKFTYCGHGLDIGVESSPQVDFTGVRIRFVTAQNQNWWLNARSNGIGFFFTSGLTIERCFLDHNGWNDGLADDDTDLKFRHNYYIQGSGSSTLTNCVFSRSASTQKIQSSGNSTCDITNCLYLRNPIQGYYEFTIGGTFNDNVLLEAVQGYDDPHLVANGWGFDMNAGAHNNMIARNIFANWADSNSGYGFAFRSGSSGNTLTGNIFYNVSTSGTSGGLLNEFNSPSTNTYVGLNDENLSAGTYSHPDRTVGSYLSLLGLGSTNEDYYTLRANMFRGNYNALLEADSINDYIRQGFNKPMLGSAYANLVGGTQQPPPSKKKHQKQVHYYYQ